LSRIRQDEDGDEGITSASPEVLAHHARLHRRTCSAPGSRQYVCGCQSSIAIACGCGRVLFVAMAPGRSPCCHALALMEEAA
jgi:hypothetical protein